MCVLCAVVCAAMIHSRSPPELARPRPLTEAQGKAFYEAAAVAEAEARQKASGRFRGSPWSQDDDFHGKEMKFILGYAKSHRFSVPRLLDSLDRGMHEDWPTLDGMTPDQRVRPCRPRLTY